MTTYRDLQPGENYVTIPWATAQDRSVSILARGLLAEMVSRPDEWRHSAERKAEESREGRFVILRAMEELEQAGYLRRYLVRDRRGRLVNRTDVSIYPIWGKRAGQTGSRSAVVGSAGAGSTASGRPVRRRADSGLTVVGTPDSGAAAAGPAASGEPASGPTADGQADPFEENRKTRTPPHPPALQLAAAVELADVVVGVLPSGSRPRKRVAIQRCQRLVDLGWTPERLEAAVRAETWTGAGGGAVISWLDGLDGPPAERPSRPPAPPWCGECDEGSRTIEVPGDSLSRATVAKCPRCHPAMIGAAGGPLPA